MKGIGLNVRGEAPPAAALYVATAQFHRLAAVENVPATVPDVVR
jgi:hypothetical protein